jgi:hypothetical protein
MNNAHDNAERVSIELRCLAYLEAAEAGDMDAIAALWEESLDWPELCQALTELSEGLAAGE